jgi:flagellar biosynthetic protein FlhB
MAENQEGRSSEDLSDEVSPYRLEEYRRKGMVAQSREVTALLGLLAAGATAYVMSPKMGESLGNFMQEVFRTDLSSRLDLGAPDVARGLFMKGIHVGLMAAAPICIAGFVLGVVGSFVQIGSIFSFEPITPDLEKLNPISGFQRVFSFKQAVDGLRIFLKTIVVGLVAYALVRSETFHSHEYMGAEPYVILSALARIAKTIFLSMIGVLGIFAVIDFIYQKFEFNKNLRLTKQEAKQEHREREGDPQIKARIRSVQREMARKRMMQAVRKADVIVTNPTHFAVALAYDKNSMAAPRVVAKGADFLAQRIKKIASEAGVPLVENVPLARTLYKSVKVGHPIPRALYQAVAEVLAYVYRLKNRL